MRTRSLLLALAGAWTLLVPAVTAEGGASREHIPPGTLVQRDVRFTDAGGPTLDVYTHPAARRARPALLVVHGGAWMTGDKRSMARVAAAAAERGFAVFNVNYSLARPGRPGFPRQHAELRAAVRWIRGDAGRLNVDPGRIGVLGTSAGGHLAALLATRGSGPLDSGARVAAAVTWSAPFELPVLGGWLGLAVKNFVGCLDAECPAREEAASPVTHVSVDDPPVLAFNSAREIVPVSQARSLAARMAEVDVPRRVRVLRGDLHGREYAARVLPASLRFLVRQLTPN